MRIGKYIRQLKELTVSPHYQSKGEFNPFYTINIDVEKDIRPFVGDGSIKFKSVEQGSGELLKNYGGKYFPPPNSPWCKFQTSKGIIVTEPFQIPYKI